jgi:hypothetical protein
MSETEIQEKLIFADLPLLSLEHEYHMLVLILLL